MLAFDFLFFMPDSNKTSFEVHQFEGETMRVISVQLHFPVYLHDNLKIRNPRIPE